MNEADTRAEIVEKKLAESGWQTNPETMVSVRREHPITTGEIRAGGIRAGILKADIVLEYKNTKLAVVEAKSNKIDCSDGIAQAKKYAKKLQLKYSFATNGDKIYQINHIANEEGPIAEFPSPEELWQSVFGDINKWQKKFNEVSFGDTKEVRYYQELAINHALKSIANNKDRVLLTLATGTGKTFIAFQIVWKLFQSRWTLQKDSKRQPRILFLADRNILANQAFLAFNSFDEDSLVRINPADIKKRGEVPTNGSVFFTIFQTFMSGDKNEPYFGQYEKDFFDLVIIDECHRGGAKDESSWRNILEHFSSAVHLGLTATPKRDANVDTYEYFGNPVFTYSLKEGTQDGFLTPFKVKRIQSNIDDYLYTDEDEVIEGEVRDDHIYENKEFNTTIVIKERERKRVQDLLASIHQSDKTIVFCKNQKHAALIRDLINQESIGKNVDYCVRVTANDGEIGDDFLRQFQDNDKTIPTILTTSQKLSTGVDAHNIRNIVLMRRVNSMVEFKQIIGRGTRLFEGKDYFTIIDFLENYLLFSDPEWDGEPLDIDSAKITSADRDNKNRDDTKGEIPDNQPKEVLRIKLSDGKVLELQSITTTNFYVDGNLLSTEKYLKYLIDKIALPKLLGNEEQLRTLWSNPMERNKLLKKLAEKGCNKKNLEQLQKLINAEDSDLFDVLSYIAYATPTMSRKERVKTNRAKIYNVLKDKQREFIDFLLHNYESEGVDVLDIDKLSNTIKAKYGSVHNAIQTIGEKDIIKKLFISFQKQLYETVS